MEARIPASTWRPPNGWPEQGIVHFGIDSMRPGPEGKENLLVHKACFELGITHIESLCNLEALLGAGPFTFIGLPMKWRGGTGSPIRAVAVFGMSDDCRHDVISEIGFHL